jgi:hypothetical protein
MDEYARAAEDFCRVVEADDVARFIAERPGAKDLRSRREVCAHVVASARLYANLVRKVRGMAYVDRDEEAPWLADSPGDVRLQDTGGVRGVLRRFKLRFAPFEATQDLRNPTTLVAGGPKNGGTSPHPIDGGPVHRTQSSDCPSHSSMPVTPGQGEEVPPVNSSISDADNQVRTTATPSRVTSERDRQASRGFASSRP